MPMSSRFVQLIFIISISCGTTWSQGSAEWVVKPEWARAHETFLAGDAMRGRGSASSDEWIAATYVASEFEGYGIKPGLADGTYVQRGELVQPVIQGRSKISASQVRGFTSLEEGKDFIMTRTSGESITGPLQKIDTQNISTAHLQPGALVLLAGNLGSQTGDFIGRALGAGAKGILRVDASLSSEALDKSVEGARSAHPHLIGVSQSMAGGDFAIIRVTKDAADRLGKLPERTALSLEIHAEVSPRYTYNAVGVLQGTDSSPATKVIVLSAHLDHLGIRDPVNGDPIYNGANDDASGTVAVLELAHALAAGPTPQRTIYFVCYGSEELGGLGSTYFREHPPVPIERIAANLEFEMIGNQDPKMPKGKLLLTGWDRSNLGPTLVQHGALLGDDPYPEQHFFERSDNYSLALKGVVAHTAGGWGTPPTYHKPDDDIAHLDFNFMIKAIQSFIEPVRWLANSDFVPQWLSGRQPHPRR